MGAEYAWVRKPGIRKAWTSCGVEPVTGGAYLNGCGVPKDWGKPVEVVMWTEETWHSEWECDERTRVIAARYTNGRVADFRANNRSSRLAFYPAENVGEPA